MNDHTMLDHLLARARTYQRLGTLARGAILTLSSLILFALLAITADALFALPAPLRALVALAALLALGGALLAGFIIGLPRYDDPRRAARALEDRTHIPDSALINAVDFMHGRATPHNPALIRAASLHARQIAASADPAALFDRPRTRYAFRAFLAVAALLILSLLLAPRVFQAIVPRYLQPFADHPPYSLLDFEVRIDPLPAVVGRPVDIHADITSPLAPPSAASIVFLNPDHTRTAMPMLRTLESDAENPSQRRRGTFTFPIQSARKSLEFYIETKGGRTRRHQLIVHPVPRFERIEVRYDYPAYANRQPFTAVIGDPPGPITALTGATVTLNIRANVPLQNGTIELIPRPAPGDDQSVKIQRFPLEPDNNDPLLVTGAFTLDISGRYRLTLTGADGTPAEHPLESDLSAVPDAPPTITLREPGMDVIAPPDWKLPIELIASDDIAVDRILLHERIGDRPTLTRELPQGGQSPTQLRASHTFDLETMNAQPGDKVIYFATAFDNHPSGAQYGETPLAVIHVVSQEDYLELARAQYQLADIQDEHNRLQRALADIEALRQAILEQARAIQAQAGDTGELTPDQQRQLDELHNQLSELADRSQALADAMQRRAEQPRLYAFEDAYAQALEDMARNLQQQAEQAQALSDARPPAGLTPLPWLDETRQALEEQAQDADQQRQAVEAIEMDFDQLQLADAMTALAQRITDITAAQREIAQRLDADPAPVQLRDLAERQAVLRDALEDALTTLESTASDARERLPEMAADAAEIVTEVRHLEVSADQQSAADAARDRRPEQAQLAADSAADKLESLHEEVQAAAAGSSNQPALQRLRLTRQAMSELMGQLRQSRQTPSFTSEGGMSGMQVGRATGSLGIVGRPQSHPAGGMDRAGGPSQTGGRAAGADHDQDGRPAESLSPDTSDAQRRAASGSALGVPTRFRQDAQAYFKRLAEDQRP